MDGPVVLRIVGLSKTFGLRWALQDVSLSVRAGEIVALVGPNGAGKSTLLRVVATLLRPTAGVVWVGDRRWPPEGPGVRSAVALLGHQPWLYPDLSAEENLRFYQRLYGWPDDPEARRTALAQVGLAERAQDRVRGFSRGMLQRLALARVWLSPARVLLLDEPFTGLDVVGVAAARRALQERAARGDAVLVALHDPGSLSVAHRVVVLVRGRAVAEGPPEAFDAAALQALYGAHGRPGRTFRRPHALHSVQEAPRQEAGASEDERPALRRKGRARAVLGALLWKDLRVEGRGRETLTPTLTLAGLSLFLFGAAFELRPDLARSFVPVFLWMLLLFVSSLGVGRMMASELDRGTWEGLLMLPGERDLLFWGKAIVHGVLIALVLALSLVAVGVFFNLSLWDPRVLVLLLLGGAGLAGVATLLATMAMATRAREMLLPLLLFPVAAPLLIAGVQGTRAALELDPERWGTWLQILLAYDMILFAVGGLVFEEAAGP